MAKGVKLFALMKYAREQGCSMSDLARRANMVRRAKKEKQMKQERQEKQLQLAF